MTDQSEFNKRWAHRFFDPLWQGAGERTDCYRWLAAQMGMTLDRCHFGHMSRPEVIKAIWIVVAFRFAHQRSARAAIKQWAKEHPDGDARQD